MLAKPTSGRTRQDEPETRARLVEAAIDSILELGFYRASSNAIAERAGVSWGVIQYYFGSREALMLAVLDEGLHRLGRTLHDAHITSETVSGRLQEYADILFQYYGAPEYLAYMQILLNFTHDPQTSEQTRSTMAQKGELSTPELQRLTHEVFAGTGIQEADLRLTVFHALRGVALSQSMIAASPDVASAAVRRQFPRERRLIVEALALLVAQWRAAPAGEV